MRKLFQNKVTIILLIIALVVLLAACNQNQGASEQAGEQIKDASEWKKQEIILKNGVPYAISLAEDLGMPTGNPIYFCIDTDVTKSQMTTYIVPYVQGILSELEGSGYKLGIYGPKPVCKYIRGTYSATERYMMICDNDWGQSGWSATERDFDDWNIRQYEWKQSLPGVSSVTIDKCESSTNGGGGWKL